MTNSIILSKLDTLKSSLVPVKLSNLKNLPKAIRMDLEYAITLGQIKTKIPGYSVEILEEKNEAIYANCYSKLIFDYYLDNFKFSDATEDEVEQLANTVGLLIDRIFYKSIPYKNLAEKSLYDNGLSDIYHTVQLNRYYTYLSNYALSGKGACYPLLLEILIENGCLNTASKIYKAYSFYISPKFLLLTVQKYYSNQEKINTLDKKITKLLINELEKLDISLYKLQSDEHETEKSDQRYNTFYNLFLQFRSLRLRMFYDSNLKFTPTDTFSDIQSGIECNICDAIDFYLSKVPIQEEQKRIVMEFLKDVIPYEIDTNKLMSLFGQTTSGETQGWMIGEDVVFFLDVVLHGCVFLLLDNADAFVQYRNLIMKQVKSDIVLNDAWLKSEFPNTLVKNYLKQNDTLKEFIADLIDLYINIRNFRSDFVDPNQMLDFIQMLEEHSEELSEIGVDAKVKAVATIYDKSPEKIDENCAKFFDRNFDNGIKESIEDVVEKLKDMEDIKKIISTGEFIFIPYQEMQDDVLDGDLTGLITCQIKAVERYLKEVVVRYARSQNMNIAVSGKGDKKRIDLTKDKFHTYKYEDGKKIRVITVVVVDEKTNAMNLSSQNNGCTSVEIGQCIMFIKENNLARSNSKSIFEYNAPKEKCSQSALYKNWVEKVRNKHMHTIPIESLSDAKEKLAKTAYWLLKIIKEIG